VQLEGMMQVGPLLTLEVYDWYEKDSQQVRGNDPFNFSSKYCAA
jgi:hypothetical protein